MNTQFKNRRINNPAKRDPHSTTTQGQNITPPPSITHSAAQVRSEKQFYHKITSTNQITAIAPPTRQELTELLRITGVCTSDVRKEFGMSKCKALHINKGQWKNHPEQEVVAGQTLDNMDKNETYKYLGFNQSIKIDHTQAKGQLTQEFRDRLIRLLKTKLDPRNHTKAINTFAIPILTYFFGIIKWSHTDIKNIHILIRTDLTKYRVSHSNACKERLTIQRGRCPRSHRITTRKNKHLGAVSTPRQTWISCYTRPHQWRTVIHLAAGWPAFPRNFKLAIQDQVIATWNYKKLIIKDPSITDDSCRKCHQQKKTVDHRTGACRTLAGTEYTAWHNSAAKDIYQALATTNQLAENTDPYYNYTPTSVLENSQYKLYWDVEIHTDKTVPANKPDIVFQSKADKVTYLIDIAIPSDKNIQNIYAGKISEYTDLAIEIKRLWKQNKVIIVPFIISVSGLTPNTFTPHLQQLGLDGKLHKIFQKSVILKTCSIVRSFLNSE
nr:unnamed protein product [Callosobruchus chinensis]